MSHNLSIYQDGTYSKDLPSGVVEELRRYGKAFDVESGKVSFCGFIMNGPDVYVFLPKGSSVESQNKGRESKARTLFKAIERYFRFENAHLLGDSKAAIVGAPQILPLVQEILDDYRRNGLYTDSSFNEQKGLSGKPNWNKTIKNILPITSGKNYIYPEFVNRVPNHELQTAITRIHTWVINDINRKFGWLYGDSVTLPSRQLYLESNSDLSLLRKELRHTFSDRKVVLINNLISYIQKNYSSTGIGRFAFGFNDFYWVWEFMLRSVLGPTANFLLPYPAYVDGSGEVTPQSRKNQRVDIFLYDKETQAAVVVDAKYYVASSAANSPGWPDLVKQFFYSKSLMAEAGLNKVKRVTNYFVFPGVASTKSPIEGFVLDSKLLRLDTEFPPVTCLHVQPELVMESFVSGKTLKNLRDSML